MPTYEYTCKSCGETVEMFQSFSEKPLRQHEECGGELQKVFHARGVVFKGSGFYATDSRGSRNSKPESSTSSDESKGKSKEKKDKSESKTPAGSPSSSSSSD